MLEASEEGHDTSLRETEAAILRDPALSEPERMALLSVYRGFMASRPRF
jgi:hypothetical protein